MSFYNQHGLINSKIDEDVAENCPLWAFEYLLIKHDEKLHEDLGVFIKKCYTGTLGLYNQRPVNNGSKEDYMSPDQLIPFSGYLSKVNKEEAKNMWTYLWTHAFTYDNLTAKINKARLQQPAAIFYLAASAGYKLALPFLSLVCIVACFQKPDQTSGKLKAWTMMKSLNMKITKTICDLVLKYRCNFKTFSGCFLEYFQEDGHPIRNLALKESL